MFRGSQLVKYERKDFTNFGNHLTGQRIPRNRATVFAGTEQEIGVSLTP